MIVFTSVAVSEFGKGLPANGKNRGSTSPAIPPTTAAVNCDGCAPRSPGNGSNVPGKLPKGIVGGAGGFVTFRYARRIPSIRILSPRINCGASKPLAADTAITSSNG